MANVLIYTTPTCPYCRQAKEWLNEKDIEFTNIDVSSDRSRAEEMVEKSGQMGVPVIDIDGKVLVGFDKKEMAEALNVEP